jgi:hypothetical protein
MEQAFVEAIKKSVIRGLAFEVRSAITTPNNERGFSLATTDNSVPTVGAPLPDFSLLGTDGATHTVADLVRDHRGMVLFYFPKANTDG